MVNWPVGGEQEGGRGGAEILAKEFKGKAVGEDGNTYNDPKGRR